VVAPASVVVQAAPAAPARSTLPPPMPTSTTAAVVIKAPTDVRISIDGQETSRSGAEEVFATPQLEPGKTYQYVFRAEATRNGKTVSDTRRVVVEAGKQAEVDFNDLVAPAADIAKVTVIVPEDAKLFVDGTECPLKSARRTFETPKLDPGRQYYYTVRAETLRGGRKVEDSRRVVVEAGRLTTVDFQDLSSVQAASR
jgi:uncharacterized protein (TIGR03000 family)